jgi:hypothetical protein
MKAENMSTPTSTADLLDEISRLLAAIASEDDYRRKTTLLKRASYLMRFLEPLSDVAQLDSLIAALNQAAKVHAFPEEIRKLRTKFLRQRAGLAGEKTTVIAKVTGTLGTDDACVRLFDSAFEEPARACEPETQRQGKCLFAKLASDGGLDGELRYLRGGLLLDAATMRRVRDSSSENVLLCPSGKLILSGLADDRAIALTVPPGSRVLASIHRIGEDKLIALVADTDRELPNDLESIEQLEF